MLHNEVCLFVVLPLFVSSAYGMVLPIYAMPMKSDKYESCKGLKFVANSWATLFLFNSVAIRKAAQVQIWFKKEANRVTSLSSRSELNILNGLWLSQRRLGWFMGQSLLLIPLLASVRNLSQLALLRRKTHSRFSSSRWKGATGNIVVLPDSIFTGFSS